MKTKLDLIQMLRGLMAIIVVLHHVNASTIFYLNENWMSGVFRVGWFGVDFFFVLSGFIMVYVHKNDLINRTDIGKFYLKRFIRIYPIYWFLASIALVLMVYTGKLSISSDFAYIIKSFLLIQYPIEPFLGVAWSLVFECFFYLIFGIAIYLGMRVMRYFLFIWMSIIIIADVFKLPISNLFIFHNYILEFLFGCIIGYQVDLNLDKYKFKPEIMIYLRCLILLVMWIISLNFDFGTKDSLESRLIYGLSASFIILGSALYNKTKDVKIPKFFLLLGNSSYVLYLIHPFVLGIGYKLAVSFLKNNDSFIFIFGLIIFVLSIISGILVHLIVERNIIKNLNYLIFQKSSKQINENSSNS